ncbi:hypothetical protein [Amycolatopsis sp. RTGN1]|uniref:hypothetical protein n=1 Tax=Amycolatopsis ponsaeliensis TaxID=2992142 RepID=UPI00254F544D|nr:hypothetical protein [Amycolatopsis sp. RTGN1]
MDHRNLADAAVRAIADHFGALRSGARVSEAASRTVAEVVSVVRSVCGVGSPVLEDLRRNPASCGVRTHAAALLWRALDEDGSAGPALGEALGRSDVAY